MADKTLYDILEVSNSASPEIIRVAYERLSEKFSPQATGDERIFNDAVKEAFVTLSNPTKRAQYDKTLELRNLRNTLGLRSVEVIEPFWTLPKIAIIAVVVLSLGGFYYKHQREQARIEAEKAIAAVKAKEAAEKARAEAEIARMALERDRQARNEEQRRQYEQQQAIRQYQSDSRAGMAFSRSLSASEQQTAARAEANRKNEEARAAAAARQQLARDKAELCRLEYERYGRVISC